MKDISQSWVSTTSVPQDFMDERQRLRQHRDRFRLHTRSAKQSGLQLAKLEQRWANLSPN